MRVALAVTTLCMTLAVGCTGDNSTTPSPVPSAEPTCPGGDKPAMTRTQIVPTGPNLHGKITVLAHTTSARPTVVHAKVTWFADGKPGINSLRASRIVLVKQVWETVRQARGARQASPRPKCWTPRT
jgi:hypothetical protein